MFRIVSIIGFVITFVGIAFCCIVFPCSRNCSRRPIGILRRVVHLFTLLLLEQKLSFIGILRKLVYLLVLLCFVVLAVTGFYQPLVSGEHLSGYLLMIHATFAPVFAACLAALAVMWAHNCRFDKNYWPWLQKLLRREPINKAVVEKYELGRNICFWLIVISALPLSLSVVLSMFPLFGTGIQEFLLNLHRYSALLLALSAIVHTYLIIRTRMEK